MTRRRQTTIPAVLAAGVLLTGLAAPVAHAQENLPGQHTGPVQFWAEGNDQCQVTFTMSNATNGAYTMDWRIDDEPLTGPNYGSGPTSKRTFRSLINQPQFSAIEPKVGYRRNFDPPLVNSETVTLTALNTLPNRGADSHTIDFRVILGPDGRDRGNGEWHTTTVSGCLTDTSATFDAPAPATVGEPVDLTVRVAPAGAAGSVQFFDAGQPIGEPVPVVDGASTLQHSFEGVGDHVLTATFTPAEPGPTDTPYGPSDAGPVTITVREADEGTGSLGIGSLDLGSLGTGSLDAGSASVGPIGFGSLGFLNVNSAAGPTE